MKRVCDVMRPRYTKRKTKLDTSWTDNRQGIALAAREQRVAMSESLRACVGQVRRGG